MEKRSAAISILISCILIISVSLIILSGSVIMHNLEDSKQEKSVTEQSAINNEIPLSNFNLNGNYIEDDDDSENIIFLGGGGGGGSSSGGSSGSSGSASSTSSSSSSNSDADSSSQESDSSESDGLDNSEDSSEDSDSSMDNEADLDDSSNANENNDENEDSETNPSDNFDSIDNMNDLSDNSQSSDDEKNKLVNYGGEDFLDIIVMLKDDDALTITGDSLSGMKSVVKRKQDKVLSDLDPNEFHLKHKYSTIAGFAGEITEEGLAKLKQNPNVEAVYEDKLLNITLIESVPLINADDVWDLEITGEGSVVCVVDTGIDYTHPALGNPGCTITQTVDGSIEPYLLESPHPYTNNYDYTWTINKPGYDNIAVHFDRIDVEDGWDFVYLYDAQNNLVQSFTGTHNDIWSVSIPGDTIKVRLLADYIITDWGFKIDQVLDGTVGATWDNCGRVIDGYDFVNGDFDPMDDHSHGTHVAGTVAANGSITDADTVGSWTFSYSGINRGRGNNWYASEDATLTEIEMYLGIPSSTTLSWFVYENTASTGNFTKIFETNTTSDTGQKFYSSGTINVELEAGKYYLIGTWWGATSVTYARGTESVPFDVSFGKLQTGIPGSPIGSTPPDIWNLTYSGFSPYYSRISTTSAILIKGVAPDAELVAVKVCSAGGGCPGSAMIAGVDWCNDRSSEYNIVATTMSIGDHGQYNSATCPTWMDNVIDTAYDLGIAVTIASGNEWYSNGISYPACSPNAISVGSTTKADVISYFTNTGDLLDLLAPGSSIYSTVLGGNYGFKSGTSMATPHVAGAIALLKQFLPLALPDEMRDALKNTGISIVDPDNGLSFPRIDILAAMSIECFSNLGCGTDAYVGNIFCQNDDVYQNHITYTCNSPGTFAATCSDSTAPKLIEDCPGGCTGGRCLVEVCKTICNFGKCHEYCKWE